MKHLYLITVIVANTLTLALSSHATVLLDDTWADGNRTIQNPPTESAWFASTGGQLSAATNAMNLSVGGSSVMIVSYFTADSASPAQLDLGDTLTISFALTLNGVAAQNPSQGCRLALCNFADSSTSRLTADSFSTSSQGTGVQGYALFQNMGTTFSDTTPMDIRKRTTVSDSALLSASGDWTSLVTGPGNTNGFPGFASGTDYVLQLSLHRTGSASLNITMKWVNIATGASLTTSATDNSATNFSFDGIALRPAGSSSTASTITFSELKVELIPGSTPPFVDTDPQDREVFVGQDAAFSVIASGTDPLSYQWYYNTNTLLADATNATLTVTSAQSTNSGSYFVIVTNDYGSATSAVAQLTVSVPVAPTIIAQPQDLTVLPGETATFTVEAGGSEPLSYQWYYNTNVLLTNATDSILTLNNVQPGDAGSYSVFVSNLAGSTNSSYAILSVNTNPVAPIFTTQPASQVALTGSTLSFTAVVAGSAPISFQWSKNGVAIPSATSSTLILTDVQLTNDDGSYTVTASNIVGMASSDPAVLTVVTTIPVANSEYNLAGFGWHTTGGGVLSDTDPNYAKVYTATDLANAINSKTVKIIEIMNDLNLGYNEIEASAKAGSEPFRAHNPPKLHPVLLQTGVSLIDIQKKNGLTIFSANGATIRHATFNVKSSGNVIIRNLKFDEMWEWDEASKGDYDGNDWDFIDLGNSGTVTNIWVDHCTFTKAYDGIIDIKGGSPGITISWCKYTGDDGATNPNSWVWQQINSLESNKTSYAFYNFLRTHSFSTTNIVTIIQGHDKTHLIGATTSSENTNFSVTLHHDWFMNPWDRLPRLRGGNVHDYNIYVDDTAGLAARRLRDSIAAAMSPADQNTLNNTYSFRPFLNGSISTEGGAMLVEKSVYIDCLTPLRNNQTDPADPFYTGKIMALDTIYQMDNTFFRGNSTDPGGTNTLGPLQAAIIPFSWNLPGNQLPYPYVMNDPGQLKAIVTSPTAGAGAGVLAWNKTNWLVTSYAPTAPVIAADPQNQSVTQGQTATFVVVAGGSTPLAYQWYFNTNTPVANATNFTLTITNVQITNAGTYSVMVSNSVEAVSSASALLTVSTNHAPVPGAYTIATAENTPVSIPTANLLAIASDDDGDILSITAVQDLSTNNGNVALANNLITYTPPADYTGSDLLNYTLTDSHNASAAGSISLTVVSSNSITLSISILPNVTSGFFRASYLGVPNLTYTVDAATNLAGPWQLAYTNLMAGTNGLFELILPYNPLMPVQFYRTRYP